MGGKKLTEQELRQMQARLEEVAAGYLLLVVLQDDRGAHLGYCLDRGDVMLLIARLVRDFGLDPDALAHACRAYLQDKEGADYLA